MTELSARDERRLERVEDAVGQIPVIATTLRNLEEKTVKTLADEVHGMKRALWGVVFSIILAVLVFALGVASGVIGGT